MAATNSNGSVWQQPVQDALAKTAWILLTDNYEIICLSAKFLFNVFHFECSLHPETVQFILLRKLSCLILNGPIQMDVTVLLCSV